MLHARIAELLAGTLADELGDERALAVLAATKAAWAVLELSGGDGERERVAAATIAAAMLAVERTGGVAPRRLRVVR